MSDLIKALLSSLGDNEQGKAALSEIIAEILLEKPSATCSKFTGEPPAGLLQAIKNYRDKLKETEELHAEAEKRLPKHDWLDWYSAYMTSRNSGLGPMSSALTSDMYVNWLLEKVAKEEAKKEEK